VPQIALFFTLISTSFGPISGTGTVSIQMPGSALALTSARIMLDIRQSLRVRDQCRRQAAMAWQSDRRPSARPTSVCGCAPALRHDRKGKADDIDATFASSLRPSCASDASPSMTGMIGWSAPASVKPSFAIPARNRAAFS
jgi:hypothetical protein